MWLGPAERRRNRCKGPPKQTGQRSECGPEASHVGTGAKYRDKQTGSDGRTMKVIHAEHRELSAHL